MAKVSAGGALAWATYLGGSGATIGYGIAVDAAGNALVTGYTDFHNFVGGEQHLSRRRLGCLRGEGLDRGARSLWATYLGGSGDDYGYGIAVDAAGNALVTGYTDSTDFAGANNSYTAASRMPSWRRSDRRRLARLGHLPRRKRRDYGDGIAVDAAGNALVTGYTDSSGWVSGGFDNELQRRRRCLRGEVVARRGTLWGTYLGGSADDMVRHRRGPSETPS